MIMEYRLAGGGTVILAKPHTIGLQGGLNRLGNAPAGDRHRDQAGLIDIQQGGKMRLGDHQGMPLVGRVDVHKA